MKKVIKRRCKAYLKRTLKTAKNHRLDFCGGDRMLTTTLTWKILQHSQNFYHKLKRE